jgi:predicted alpha/beta superfamily hydrolase
VITRTFKNVWSPERRNRRDIDIYLPASYSARRDRYPVVYMHDGQNLSDPNTAFAGTWELEPTLERLAARGIEAIVVGVHNAGADRLAEYSPFPDRRHGGGDADAYLAFLAHSLKPRIDRTFRTRPERDATVVLGSSMGGLASLYAYFRYPSVFGRAGVMSPSIWFGQGLILDFILQARTPPGRLYLDVGTQEGAGTLRDARRAGRDLVRKGFARDRRARRPRATQPGPDRRTKHEGKPRLRYVEHVGGRHTEADWAYRLAGALEFLLR